jgi:hypothetical protein
MFESVSPAEDARVEEIGAEELATTDPDGLMFVNVNTPHDFERAKKLIDRLSGSDAATKDRITDIMNGPSSALRRTPHTT